jgi:DNA repair protein RecN (Recombination protein N)
MLEELHIRDIALIKDAWIEPSAGFTVFTGETGAGKTVLLNALKLIMGERGDLSLIRHGAQAARIEAQFSDDVLASRQLNVTGRNRCTLNNELVTVGKLAEVLGPSIDLHGQHDHQALLRPATHGEMLDRWGGERAQDLLRQYRQSFDQYKQAVEKLADLKDATNKSAEEIELGRISLAEIESIDPQVGEDDALNEILPALQHAGELSEAITAAQAALQGEGGAAECMGEARNQLTHVAQYDRRLDEVIDSLNQAIIDIDETELALRAIRGSFDSEDASLEEVVGRLGALDGLKRRFGPSLDMVLERRERLTTLLATVENSDEELAQTQKDAEIARSNLQESAQSLHDARLIAADELAKELRAGVISLDMKDAAFEIKCELLPFDQFTRQGPARIEILYQPSPNSTMRPLSKIASGGEISRVMLALKGVLGNSDDAQTLVFDEIDAGIGGATATLIGKRLAHLARNHQVIVVTHLAQVAVYADKHYIVDKQTHDNEVETMVSAIEDDAREAEIARMLSGDTTDAAREHARELFANAII